MVFVRHAAVLLMQQKPNEATKENNSEQSTKAVEPNKEDPNKSTETEATEDVGVIISNTSNETNSELDKPEVNGCNEELNGLNETDNNRLSENDLNDNLKEAANVVLAGKCPILNGLDAAGIQHLADNISNVTEEAARALAETQKKDIGMYCNAIALFHNEWRHTCRSTTGQTWTAF